MALISVAEAAKALGLSKGTLYGLIRARKIPHFRAGDRILLNLEKVMAAIEVEVISDEEGPSVKLTQGQRKRL